MLLRDLPVVAPREGATRAFDASSRTSAVQPAMIGGFRGVFRLRHVGGPSGERLRLRGLPAGRKIQRTSGSGAGGDRAQRLSKPASAGDLWSRNVCRRAVWIRLRPTTAECTRWVAAVRKRNTARVHSTRKMMRESNLRRSQKTISAVTTESLAGSSTTHPNAR